MNPLGLERRRLGTGLVAFGVVGIILAASLAVALVVAAIGASSLDDRVETLTGEISASLERSAEAMIDAVEVIERTRSALGSGAAAVRESASTLDTLATATDDLADSLDFTILGQRPLAGVAGTFAIFAADLDDTSAELDELSVDLAELDASLGPIADDLRSLQRRFDELASRLADLPVGGATAGLTILLALLAAVALWLLAAAGAATWIGWRIRSADPTAAVAPDADGSDPALPADRRGG